MLIKWEYPHYICNFQKFKSNSKTPRIKLKNTNNNINNNSYSNSNNSRHNIKINPPSRAYP